VQTARPVKSDLRAAARYVTAQRQSDDLLIYQIPHIRYTFSYYASGRQNPEDPAWSGVEGPYTNNGMSPAAADAWIATRLGAANVVWLISSETSMWDARNLTEQWFTANATATDRVDFSRVAVTRYVR
jgi:hypothetical protein